MPPCSAPLQEAAAGFTDAIRLASPLSAACDGQCESPGSSGEASRVLAARLRVGRSKAYLAAGSTARCVRTSTISSLGPLNRQASLPPSCDWH